MKDYTAPEKKQQRQARRTELAHSKKQIQEQLSELKGRLPSLVKPGAQPEKQGSISKKRPGGPLLPDGGLESKRQRLEQERSRRVNGVWQQCQTILKAILKSKDAFAFLKPVNPVTSKCPDYFDIIKHPMDLGTIQKKLPKGRLGDKKDAKEYSTPYQFRDDMRLVWSNCRNYNAVGHAVRTMGDTLSETWEKKWALSGIEAKWEEEMQRQELENKEVAGGDLAQQLHSLDSALQQRMSSVKPPVEEPGDGMNFERKRRLSIALGQLPGDRIADVMRIIIEDPSMRDKGLSNSEEVEIDIDQLTMDTLSKLERYANGILHSIKKKTGTAKPQPAAQPTKPSATNGAGTAPENGVEERSIAQPSSPSSSDSETERSHSRSHSNVGSQNESTALKGEPPGQALRPTDTGNDAATLISTTRPPNQPQIVRNMAEKKVTNLQNEMAWNNLGKDDGDPENGDGNGEKANAEDDTLWDEFRSREQEEEQREKEKREEELRQAEIKEKARQTAKLEAEQAKKEAEKEAQEEGEKPQISSQREQELEEMKKAGMGGNFTTAGVETIDSRKQGEALNNVLGLQRRDSDSDEDDE